MMEKDNQGSILQCVVAVTAVCLVFTVMQGIHDNYGVMLGGIVEQTNVSYASVSFVIAVGQILYGVTQPLFGMLALKKIQCVCYDMRNYLNGGRIDCYSVLYNNFYLAYILRNYSSFWNRCTVLWDCNGSGFSDYR